MSEQSVTGRLENWIIVGSMALGDLYDDQKSRWPDGTPIHTSAIVSDINGAVEGAVITTRNSTYRLGKPCAS